MKLKEILEAKRAESKRDIKHAIETKIANGCDPYQAAIEIYEAQYDILFDLAIELTEMQERENEKPKRSR